MSNTAPWITVQRKKRQASPSPYPPITITLPARQNNVLGSPINLDSEREVVPNVEAKGGKFRHNLTDKLAKLTTTLNNSYELRCSGENARPLTPATRRYPGESAGGGPREHPRPKQLPCEYRI